MKFINAIVAFASILLSPIRGASPVGDFTPDAQGDAVIIARAQLAASAGLVGDACRTYGDLKLTDSGPFLFVGKSSYEWSVGWVVWIVGDERRIEAGAFSPDLPQDRQWLSVFATKGTDQYARLRDYHRRAVAILASPVRHDPAQAAIHGRRKDTFMIASGEEPSQHDYYGTDTALGTQGGKAASMSIDIIRYLQNARIKPKPGIRSNATPDESRDILTQVETAMKKHNRPKIEAMDEGQVCAILANGQTCDYLEIVQSAKGDNVLFTHVQNNSAAQTVVLKKDPKADAPFPSEEVRALFAASAAAFAANLEVEAATNLGEDREVLLIARKQGDKIIYLARRNTDCDPPEPELRPVLKSLRSFGNDLRQPIDN